ncbi:hypothetical protein OV450_2798 [Actinobacteria bacterium OV450]|nr:hypothetical protein OV450_2798 [Actinobacteria bacterium OV450]
MHSLQFTAESSSDGIRERDFTVGAVPGVLRSPALGADGAPLVLMGHGGGNHKKHPAMAGRARLLVNGCGVHVTAIDAPGTATERALGTTRRRLPSCSGRGRQVGLKARSSSATTTTWHSLPYPTTRRPRTPSRTLRTSAPTGRSDIGASTWAPRSACRSWRPNRGSPPRSSASTGPTAWPKRQSRSPFRSSSICSGMTSTSLARRVSRCSTPSPRRRSRCTGTRASTRSCPGPKPRALSGSSHGTSAQRPRRRPDMGGCGALLAAGRRNRGPGSRLRIPVCRWRLGGGAKSRYAPHRTQINDRHHHALPLTCGSRCSVNYGAAPVRSWLNPARRGVRGR